MVNLQARLPGFKRKFPELQQNTPVKGEAKLIEHHDHDSVSLKIKSSCKSRWFVLQAPVTGGYNQFLSSAD